MREVKEVLKTLLNMCCTTLLAMLVVIILALFIGGVN